MSPRSIWTACLTAVTIYTPMGACAGLPDGLAGEPGETRPGDPDRVKPRSPGRRKSILGRFAR